MIYDMISRVYTDDLQYDESIKYCLKAKKLIEQQNIKIDSFMTYFLIFENYINLNKIDSAKKYFSFYKQFNIKNTLNPGMLPKYYNLYGRYLLSSNDKVQANLYFKKSDSVFRSNYILERGKLIGYNTTTIEYYNKEKENNIKYQRRMYAVFVVYNYPNYLNVFLF